MRHGKFGIALREMWRWLRDEEAQWKTQWALQNMCQRAYEKAARRIAEKTPSVTPGELLLAGCAVICLTSGALLITKASRSLDSEALWNDAKLFIFYGLLSLFMARTHQTERRIREREQSTTGDPNEPN